MSDEEKKDVVDETAQDETSEAAGPVAAGDASEPQPAGPVAAGDPPPPAVAKASSGEVPPATPPAGEADAAKAEESEAESVEPAAEETAPAETAEPSEEDQLPWKEKRRLEGSRRPHEAGPALSAEERVAQRAAARKLKAESRRKERGAAKAGKTAGTGTPPAEKDAVAAKTRQGVVVSNKGEKSITVRIDIARRHPTYEKVVRRSRTLHAHDERNEAGEGDIVRVVETRPLSKTKRWRLVEVLERAK
jgi:small subunit ribosomal protein S17